MEIFANDDLPFRMATFRITVKTINFVLSQQQASTQLCPGAPQRLSLVLVMLGTI